MAGRVRIRAMSRAMTTFPAASSARIAYARARTVSEAWGGGPEFVWDTR
jgi:hypothetical protein